MYDEKLFKLGLSSIQTQSDTISNNHKFVIKAQDRDNLKAYLASKGIQTQIHYVSPLSKMKMFYTDQQMPNAERFGQDVLSLPMHPFLEDYEVAYVCNCIGEFYGV